MSNLVSSPKNVVYVNGGQTYNVSAADDVINVNSTLGATEIVLPNIVNQGLDFYPKKFTINDTGGAAGTYPITISAVGNLVNSSASTVLNRNNVSSEVVIVSKTEYLVNTDNGGVSGIFGSGTVGQLAYFSASTVLGSLTNTQVTALLNNFVGDSGSGGTKGLVPAPAIGDAAANKYLKADGTWNAISLAGYLKADGTVPLTANWDVGAFEVTAQSLKVDGTAGAGHLHLRYQSSIPSGAANNSKLFAGATGALGWVVDSNAYAFYLDMTGNTASRTLTVPDASGTIALTSDIVNLGNSNLTASAAVRSYTLAGTASTDYLDFLTGGAGNLLRARGDGRIGLLTDTVDTQFQIGKSGSWKTGSIYVDGTSGLTFYSEYAASQNRKTLDFGGLNLGRTIGWYNTNSGELSGYVQSSTGGLVLGSLNTLVPFTIYDGGGTVMTIGHSYVCSIVQMYDRNYSSVNPTVYINSKASNGIYFIRNNVSIGSTNTSLARFLVQGSGATSATTTVLFQNSASTNIFKVLDNGNTILNLPSTVAADSDIFNNGVNLYTDGTSLKARYKNNGGTSSDLLVGSNLGNANLTSADNARTFTLKTGTTSTQNFSILNSDGDVGYYFNGVGNVGIGTTTFAAHTGTASEDFVVGNSTSGTNTSFYLDNTGDRRYYAFQLLQKNSKKLYNVDTRGIVTYFDIANGTNSDVVFDLSAGGTKIQTSAATSATFSTHQSASSNGSVIYQMGSTVNNSGGYIYINNGSGTNKIYLSGNRSGIQATWFGEGAIFGGSLARSATAIMDVMGSGSTSATITALFQNSSSSAALTIKDDLTSTFGGIITTPQIITTPATVTVAANAGTVTRSYRNNNFTNSSAATMTITMSLTSALDGDMVMVRIFDFSAVAQTITWVNTENSSITVPTTSNGSTTLPLTVGFQYNSATSKWRCIGSV
jgi:hypothetical protein